MMVQEEASLALAQQQILAATTEFLTGASPLERAAHRAIQAICENLGWEWGAYWTLDDLGEEADVLKCAWFWRADAAMDAFAARSTALRMRAGEGLVGQTWGRGEPAWVRDVASDDGFLRRAAAAQCGLHGGYAFPVACRAQDGRSQRSGVLEFYSAQAGKRERELPRLSAAVGAFLANSAQRQRENRRLQQLVRVDELSGVSKRAHFHALLEAACDDALRQQQKLAVLCVRLHRARQVSEGLGYEASKRMMHAFAERLKRCLPAQCQVGRLFAGEFAVLAPPSALRACGAGAMVAAITRAAAEPFVLGTSELATSVSIGTAWFPADATQPNVLLQVANGRLGEDTAMQPYRGMPLPERLRMESDLKNAVAGNALFLVYQPVVDADAHVTAVEALVRWRRADGTVVPPDHFIPFAESSGLVGLVDRWVAARAIADLGRLRALGHHTLRMNINIAADELVEDGLCERLVSLAQQAGVPCHRICLELTERIDMKDPDLVSAVLGQLRDCGFGLSIDDFGTGYSSLRRILQLPFTSIKMDRSFVQGIPGDAKTGPIVRTILDLGKHSRLPVIAEGVETDRQLIYLRQFGCAQFQGYLFSRPLPLPELLAYLREHPCAKAPGLAMGDMAYLAH